MKGIINMDKNTSLKMAEIKAEQEKYKCKMSIEEMIKMQQEYDRSRGEKPITLEQINQYIDEVRRGL